MQLCTELSASTQSYGGTSKAASLLHYARHVKLSHQRTGPHFQNEHASASADQPMQNGMKLTEACINQMSCCAGVVLEEAENIIKGVIADNDMLPKHYKHLDADAWGIELADYFECVAGKTISELNTAHANHTA